MGTVTHLHHEFTATNIKVIGDSVVRGMVESKRLMALYKEALDAEVLCAKEIKSIRDNKTWFSSVTGIYRRRLERAEETMCYLEVHTRSVQDSLVSAQLQCNKWIDYYNTIFGYHHNQPLRPLSVLFN